MRELVRTDVVDEILDPGAHAQRVALRAGEKGEVRHVDQRRPRLAEVPFRLLRDGHSLVRQRTEIVVAGARGVDAVRERRLRELARVDADEARPAFLLRQGLEAGIDLPEDVRCTGFVYTSTDR
jgi:hypothetical protein